MNGSFYSVVFGVLCLFAAEYCFKSDATTTASLLRLRGGTGQGGPSRGFRSNGKSFKWRHPMTMFARAHNINILAKKKSFKLANVTKNMSPDRKRQELKRAEKLEAKLKRKAQRKRENQPWYLNFATPRGKRWLEEAMKDEAFRLGMGAKIIAFENVSYSVKAQMKLPKEFKRMPYDFTNRYIGGPRQG